MRHSGQTGFRIVLSVLIGRHKFTNYSNKSIGHSDVDSVRTKASQRSGAIVLVHSMTAFVAVSCHGHRGSLIWKLYDNKLAQ